MSSLLNNTRRSINGSDRYNYNTTPQPFQDLASPIAMQLRQMMQNPAQWQGGYAAPMTGGEQTAMQNVDQSAAQVGTQNPYAQFGLTQQAMGQMNPFAGAAGMGAGERFGLNQIAQTAFGPNQLQMGVNQNLQQLIGGTPNPYGQQLMDAAVRPILDNFNDQALQQRGLYTGAGQQIQGAGSSPFAQASARLSGNVANAVGDTTAQLGANLFGQQQQTQLNALNMAMQQPGMQLQNQLSATQALGLPREIQQLGMNNRASAFESGAGRQLDASGQLGQQNLMQQQAQLQAQLANLEAQGLPRLVQQLGIEGGLNQFNQQQSQLLQLMALMGGLPTSGAQGHVQETGGSNAVFLNSLAQSGGRWLGGGMAGGGAMSDRRVKRDITPAGATPNGTKVYRFRYLNDDTYHIGVIADEVEHIPNAVHRNAVGLAFVDYSKVIAHG